MNTFQRKALSSAVLAGLGLAAGAAHAVYQSPNGLGQALVYPYYTVQQSEGNAYNTYVSIVNTTTQGKAVKVRFREGRNSAEVLDFNLYMSPNDVWTAAVIPVDGTATSAARLITTDTSCTNPAIPAGGVDFRNFAYLDAGNARAGTGVDRTREGYLEVIEMATIGAGALLTGITHVNGVPANCGVIRVDILPTATLAAPTGGLAGTYTLINVNNGADMSGNATALANFSAGIIFTDVGNERTNLGSADPVAVVVADQPTGTTIYTANFGFGLDPRGGFDAVSATMMHQSVINEYILDSATRSNTDWVMTFPTKGAYIALGATDTGNATPPFTNTFTAAGACEQISFAFFDREERPGQAAPGDFSPRPPEDRAGLCWESTVLSIRNGATHMPTTAVSGVLGSRNTTAVNVTSGFQNGWARLTFTGTNSAAGGIGLVSTAGTAINANTGTVSATPPVFHGLPVVGFMVRNLFNGTLTCQGFDGGPATACQGTYGGLLDHKYEQNITPVPNGL